MDVPSTLVIERRIQRQKLAEAKRRKKEEALLAQAEREVQDEDDGADDSGDLSPLVLSENRANQIGTALLEEDRGGSREAVVMDEAQ